MKFLKKTNLDAVKEMATAFLYTDFDTSGPLAPAIISHPFTTSAFVSVPGYKSGIINVLEDEVGLAKWQEYIKSMIRVADSVEGIMMLVMKNYRICLLGYILPHLSIEDMSSVLSSVWKNLEHVNDNGVMPQKKLLALFKQSVPSCLMSRQELSAFQKLPDTVTIYRGFTEEKNPNYQAALSWTTSRNTARWFALRFSDTGKVAKAVIAKEHIFAFFSPGSENEVIVDPKFIEVVDVKNVRQR